MFIMNKDSRNKRKKTRKEKTEASLDQIRDQITEAARLSHRPETLVDKFIICYFSTERFKFLTSLIQWIRFYFFGPFKTGNKLSIFVLGLFDFLGQTVVGSRLDK